MLINIIESAIIKRTGNFNIIPGIQNICELIYRNNGNIKQNEISDIIGYSTRHINRLIYDRTGVNYKQYAQIIRFFSNIRYCTFNKTDSHGDYFDQSHLIREIKKYSGMTPKKLFDLSDSRFIQLFGYKKAKLLWFFNIKILFVRFLQFFST